MNLQELETLRGEVGDAILALHCDVRHPQAVERSVDDVESHWGSLDGVVHSAYWTRAKPAVETDDEIWHTTLDVILKGAYLLAKYSIPVMLRRKGGVIVPVASVHSFVGFRGFFAYQVAKAGLLGFVRSIAADYGPTIRCNALAPGAVDTPALRDASKEVQEEVRIGSLLKRVATAEEIARATIFLLSDESSFMTGSTLVVDGGWTAV